MGDPKERNESEGVDPLADAWIGISRGFISIVRRDHRDPQQYELRGEINFNHVQFNFNLCGFFLDATSNNPRVFVINLIRNDVVVSRGSVLLEWEGDTPKPVDQTFVPNNKLGITMGRFVNLLNKIGIFMEQPGELT